LASTGPGVSSGIVPESGAFSRIVLRGQEAAWPGVRKWGQYSGFFDVM
jgi:hypothetical protein